MKLGILPIDSPLHRLWRSFPRRGAGQFRRGTFFPICAVPPHRLRRSSPFEGSLFAYRFCQFRRKTYGISLIFSTAHMRLIAKSYPGSLTLTEKAWPSSQPPRSSGSRRRRRRGCTIVQVENKIKRYKHLGGLLEAVGGNKSKRFKAVSTVKDQNDSY